MRLDLDTYAARAARLDLSGLDFAAFRDQPLDDVSLRCLRYMHDVEYHTVCYLRDLLVTPAHRDPRVTTFLTVWSFEEMWHGEAIGRVLTAHGDVAGRPRIAELRHGLGARDRIAPALHALGAAVAGGAFGALHMTWGAVNEWTTQAGYARLINRARHPVLTDLLNRIMRQEGRHIAFYAGEAEERLAGHAGRQRVVRAALSHLWRPVGAGVMPVAEVGFMVRTLFGGEGRLAGDRIDAHVDRLPGLADLHLVRRALDRYGADPAPGPGTGPTTGRAAGIAAGRVASVRPQGVRRAA
jgi:hypothetical protein